jgi:hypothetical protein
VTADDILSDTIPNSDSDSGYAYRDPVPTESKLPFLTAAALTALAPERVNWIVPGFVAPGVVTEADGKLKASGKTTFLAHMVRSIVTGCPFLNCPTQRSPVIWLTEERAQTFGETLRRAQLDTRTDIHVLHWHSVKLLAWPVLMKRVTEHAKTVGAKVIIIDTIAQWAAFRGDSENQTGSQMEAAAPLQLAASAGLAIVVARHERKSGGDVGESGRGGSAFSARCGVGRNDQG